MQDPQTNEEWQEAVDAAELMLLIDSAKQYGLITGGPGDINIDRCVAILDEGKRRGFTPAEDVAERAFVQGAK